MLTGIKDIDTIILNNLEDKDLVNVFQVNKTLNAIGKDQMFWLNRILHKFQLSIEILNRYISERLWSQYYIELSKTDRDDLVVGAELGRLDWVILSIKMGADIHTFGVGLITAAKNGHINIVRYLVEMGANIHIDLDCPIGRASEYGHIDIVKYLVDKGANIHEVDDYAVRMASQNGHFDIVKYLVDKGADINLRHSEPIRMAIKHGHLEMVKYLVSAGTDIHMDNDILLLIASQFWNLDIVKYLIEIGVNSVIEQAIKCAQSNGYLETVNYLKSLNTN